MSHIKPDAVISGCMDCKVLLKAHVICLRSLRSICLTFIRNKLLKQKGNIMEGKESLERIFAQLSEEQKEKFRNCKNMDEIIKLASEENFELSEEQLDYIAGAGAGNGCGCGDCYGDGCNRWCHYEHFS